MNALVDMLRSVYCIANQEFSRVMKSPLVYIVLGILFVIAALSGYYWSYQVNMANASSSYISYYDYILSGLGDVVYSNAMFLAIVALSIGVLSVMEDRAKSTISVLLTKPVYRRDIILGKFFGLSSFMLFLSAFASVMDLAILMVFDSGSVPVGDCILRLVTIIVLLTLECSITICITMLAGLVFKNLLAAVSVVVTWFFVVWFAGGYLLSCLGNLSAFISPELLFMSIIFGMSQMVSSNRANLTDISYSYSFWLGSTLPLMIVLVLEPVVLTAVNCVIFMREE